MTVADIIKKIFLWEIVKGLSLTMSVFIKGLFDPFAKKKTIVTRRYPKEKRQSFPGFRGLHALVRNPATGEPMMLSPRKIVTFKCSGKLREKINR